MLESVLTPLAPVLILMLGAAVTKLAAGFMPSRERDALALLMAGAAFVSTLFLACQPASPVVISPWQPLTPLEGQLTYTSGGLAAPFALLTSLVGLAVAISLSKWRRETDDNGESPLYPAVFVVSAAGLSFIYSANLVTLCLSWAFLDLSLLFLVVSQGRNQAASNVQGRALISSSLTGLGLVVVALLLDGYGLSSAFGFDELASIRFRLLSPSRYSTQALSILLVAALVRASFYPLHFWMMIGAEMGPPASVLLQTVPVAAGLSLLARFQELSPQGLPYGSYLATLSSLALLATALAAWAEQDRRRAVSYIALNQVALAVLTAMAGQPAQTSLLWSAISLALCLGLLGLWPPKPERVGRYGLWLRVPTGLAMASLMGLPFTMGFVGRVALYRSLFALGRPHLWALSMVAEALLCATLFRIGADLLSDLSGETVSSEWTTWGPHLAGVIILAVPLVLLGIHPPLASLAADMDLPTVAQLIGRADIALWSALLLPLAGGYLLHRGQRATLERSAAFWRSLTTLLDLDWLYRWLWRVGWGIGAVLRGLAQVTEGAGYLGWTLLLAFIAFLFLSGK